MRTDMNYRNKRAEMNIKASAKRRKRIEEAKKAKEEHDEKMLNIVKEKTGINQQINIAIKIDEL